MPRGMQRRLLFVTGTDTGVGKTVLTALLARRLRDRGLAVAALKPICSGGRGDARILHRALSGALPLETINPWHFRAPLAPLLAARRARRRVRLAEVVAHVRRVSRQFDVVLVEGAGGLLSPLGEGFDSRDLLLALGADPIVVGPNRLGVINAALLTLGALPGIAARRAKFVLMGHRPAGPATRTNRAFLAGILSRDRVREFPRLAPGVIAAVGPVPGHIRPILDALCRGGLQDIPGNRDGL